MRTFQTLRPARVLVTAMLMQLAACNDSVLEQTLPPAGSRISVIQGNGQIGEAGAPLPVALAVRVSDSLDRPLAGVKVQWAVEPFSTGGSVVAQTLTDAMGVARTQRVLGPIAGEHYTIASVDGLPAQTFTSIALVQGAFSMELAPGGSGDLQADTVKATLAPFRVLVRDHQGRPVPGVNVAWSVFDGTVVGSLRTPLSLTGQDGVAENVMTLGTLATATVNRQHMVGAYVDGLRGSPIRFTATAFAGKPVALRPLHDGQIGAIQSTVQLHATALDAYDNVAVVPPLEWAVVSGDASIHPEPFSARAWLAFGASDGNVRASASAVDMPSVVPAVFTSTAVTRHVLVKQTFDLSVPPSFSPVDVQIPVGRLVGWTWEPLCYYGFYYYYTSCENHNIVFEDDPTVPTSSPLTGASRHIRTFTKPGVIRYRCTIHSRDFDEGMVGSVTVTGP